MICGTTFDNSTGTWRNSIRNYRRECEWHSITNFLNGQRLVLKHLMNKNDDNTIKVVINWIPREKRSRGRYIKSQLDIVENDLKRLDVHE